MRIIFFDTETTGKEVDDKLCQLAIAERGASTPTVNNLFNPGKPIPFEASAVHHISNTMVKDAPLFTEWSRYAEIKDLFEADNTIAVAHNARFDIDMLAHDAIVPKCHICTLKVVRALDSETKRFTNYKLQYLRYALGMELTVGAHDALADVIVLEQLFEFLLHTLQEKGYDEVSALAEMERISNEPTLLTDIPFGKYRGKTLAEVARVDKGYLQWLLDQKLQQPQGEEDWIYSLRQYLS